MAGKHAYARFVCTTGALGSHERMFGSHELVFRSHERMFGSHELVFLSHERMFGVMISCFVVMSACLVVMSSFEEYLSHVTRWT